MSRKIRKLRQEFYLAVLLVLVVVAATACSTAPPQSSNMVPDPPARPANQATSSLRAVVLTETGQGRTVPATTGVFRLTAGAFEPADWARVTDAMFRDSLTQALIQSGLFKSVNGESNPDYELEGRLYTQQLSTSGFELIATIGIRYKLTALPSNKRVWSDNIVSQGATGKRESDANEIAMRNNLSQLVDQLSKLPLNNK
jgi:hypothetical protein